MQNPAPNALLNELTANDKRDSVWIGRWHASRWARKSAVFSHD